MLRLVLTTLQCLSASRENPARQHASGRQALKRQHIFTLLSAENTDTHRQTGQETSLNPDQTSCSQFDESVYTDTDSLCTHVHTETLLEVYLRTENILAIFPIARILFLITSLRAAAALAEKK